MCAVTEALAAEDGKALGLEIAGGLLLMRPNDWPNVFTRGSRGSDCREQPMADSVLQHVALSVTRRAIDRALQQDVDASASTAASEEGAASPGIPATRYAHCAADYTARFDALSGPLPCFPPPSHESLEASLPRRGGIPPNFSTPFISSTAGALPRGTPRSIDDLISRYLVAGTSRSPPNIDVDFESVECGSNGEARRRLAAAAANERVYWAAIHVPTIEHPDWWPVRATPVPGFSHLIVGSGRAGIGMHRDRYCGAPDAANSRTEAAEQLVSTYLALGHGRKHVVLLPPTEEGARVAEGLGGLGCDDKYGRRESQRVHLPPRPPPDVLKQVLDAGGYWFDLEAPSKDARGEEGEEEGEEECEGEEDEEEDDDDEEEDAEEEDDEDSLGDAQALFIPAGWWHWLVGDSEWHVAWSGSIFPTKAQLRPQNSHGAAAGNVRGGQASAAERPMRGKGRRGAHGRERGVR